MTKTKKKTVKYVLYGMKRNSMVSKTLNSGSVRVSSNGELVRLLSDKYGIKKLGGLHYDGRCGIYTIYKTGTDKEGRYLLLHIAK